MRSLKRFFARLSNSSTSRRDDQRLQEEIEEHFALQTADNLRAGLSPSESRRQAVLKFGAAEAIRVRLHITVRRVVLLLSLLIGVPGLGQKQQPPVDNAPFHASQTVRDAPQASSPTAIEEAPAKSGALLRDLTPGPDGELSQDQMQRVLRVVADKDIENDKRQRDYTYIEREVNSKLGGNGKTKSTEVRTYEILEIYGEQVQKLIAKDDKPLNARRRRRKTKRFRRSSTSARTNQRPIARSGKRRS